MEYSIDGRNIILTKNNDFVISQTLECGQCFRFEKVQNEDYNIIAMGKKLHIFENEKGIIFENTTRDDFENIWINYFDFNRNYSEIKNILSDSDDIVKTAVEYASGIRILNQDFFECLISFIISQNNRIPMIKKVVSNISQKYGKSIDGKDYAFPSCDELLKADEAGLMECKTGFRARDMIDAVEKVSSGEIRYEELKDMSTADVRKTLMTIKGVGPKVADCVMLFSMGRSDAFPTDVWVKRVMSYFYFNNAETPLKTIQALAEEKFASYAGFAQQYLFNYARDLKIGSGKKENEQ